MEATRSRAERWALRLLHFVVSSANQRSTRFSHELQLIAEKRHPVRLRAGLGWAEGDVCEYALEQVASPLRRTEKSTEHRLHRPSARCQFGGTSPTSPVWRHLPYIDVWRRFGRHGQGTGDAGVARRNPASTARADSVHRDRRARRILSVGAHPGKRRVPESAMPALFACPACRGRLAWSSDGARCRRRSRRCPRARRERRRRTR